MRAVGKVPGRSVLGVAGAGAALLVAALAAGVPAGPAGAAGGIGKWEVTEAPLAPRTADHSATPLADGRVLVVGGLGPGEFSAKAVGIAEVFDPHAEQWAKTGPLAGPARHYHRATLLDDGRVLVTGGIIGGQFVSAAELFDPAAGTWKATAPMRQGRLGHTATLLSDGRVLVAGGVVAGEGVPTGFSDSAELFDPGAGTWAEVAKMPTLRAEHTATLLGDGTVLIAGGHDGPQTPALRDALLFDPKAGTWATVPRLMGTGRAAHTATLLRDGTVVLAGGSEARDHGGGGRPLRSTELFDPAAGDWQPGSPLGRARLGHAATELSDGRLLVVGGLGAREEGVPQPVDSAEVYDPAVRRWSLTAPLPAVATSRRDRVMRVFMLAGHPTATLIAGERCAPNCGRVLALGGDTAKTEAQLFTLDSGGSGGNGVLLVVGSVGLAALVVGVGLVARRRKRRVSGWR